MTCCPDPGAVRAALDGERPDVDPHVHTCAVCRERAEQQRDDAAFAAAALTGSLPDVDVEAALARSQAHRTPGVVPLRPRGRRAWTGLGRVAAAVVVVAVTAGVLATPGGRVAAASLLERFRAERVAVVPLDLATVDPTALEALAEVAQVEGLERLAEPREVADVAAAAAVAGFAAAPLDTAALPASVTGPVRVLAQPPQTLRVTFPDDDDVPAALRDAALVLGIPGAVVQTAGGENGAPVVVRGEAGTLEVTVEGGRSLADVRDALLSLPGLPAETVTALRAIEDWETTLPLPVPVGDIAWQETTVDGRPAVAFGDESGLGSALLWHDGDRFVGVGGMLPLSQVRRLAESR
jgi:hypothetical protein